MEYIKWNHLKYGLDIKILDEQHQRLVNIVNEIAQYRDTGADKEEIKQILIYMIEYTKTHFSDEEQIMKICHYDELIKHQKEHRYFFDKVRDFVIIFNKKKVDITEDILFFLRDWTLSHIQNEDTKISAFIKSKGIDIKKLEKSLKKQDFQIKLNNLNLEDRHCPICNKLARNSYTWTVFFHDMDNPVCSDCVKQFVPELHTMLDYYYGNYNI